jgi:hypothetical protein
MTTDDDERNLPIPETVDQALWRATSNLGRWRSTNESKLMLDWIAYRFEHYSWQLASQKRATPPRQPEMNAQLATWVAYNQTVDNKRDMDIWVAEEICDALDFNWHKIPPEEMEDALEKVDWFVDTLDAKRLKAQFPKRPNPRGYFKNQIQWGRQRFKEDCSNGTIKLPKRRPGRPADKLDADIEAAALLAIELLEAGKTFAEALKPALGARKGRERNRLREKLRRAILKLQKARY